MARDREVYFENTSELEAEGIGPLANQQIRIAGLCGGGLSLMTGDGWRLESVTLNWPEEIILLVAPGSWLYGALYDRPDKFTKICQESEIRAYGFSPTGRALIIATSSDLTIYHRET
jgi:hypothetical protein